MYAVTIPKWGLSMEEGTIVQWHKQVGDPVAEGEEIVDIETDKINNGMESPASGVLRRIVAPEGEKLKVGALIAVLAATDTPDADIDSFVERYGSGPDLTDAVGTTDSGFVSVHVDTHLGPLHLVRGGPREGTPVVLLHGFASDLNSWLFTMDAIARKHPVIALDLPGHGESTKLVGDGSTAEVARAVAQALRAIGVQRAHVVAHSWGAAVAAQLAAQEPGLFDRLAVIAPALYPGTALSMPFLEGLATGRKARELQPWLQQLVVDPSLITAEMTESLVRFKRIDGVEEALEQIRGRLGEADEARAVQQALLGLAGAVNLLLIEGEQDAVVGRVDGAALPIGTRAELIARAGHVPHLEQAAQVNALLLDVLSPEAA